MAEVQITQGAFICHGGKERHGGKTYVPAMMLFVAGAYFLIPEDWRRRKNHSGFHLYKILSYSVNFDHNLKSLRARARIKFLKDVKRGRLILHTYGCTNCSRGRSKMLLS